MVNDRSLSGPPTVVGGSADGSVLQSCTRVSPQTGDPVPRVTILGERGERSSRTFGLEGSRICLSTGTRYVSGLDDSHEEGKSGKGFFVCGLNGG